MLINGFIDQRQIIAQKMRQKRQTGAAGMVQASAIPGATFISPTGKWVAPANDIHGNFLFFIMSLID